MGAAAFHNELINQLAEAYLSYRQKELKQKVSPEKFQEELQKVKAYIATNNTYGVDLNPTAIELGKLSLWLNVIHKDMETPFFGYRLGVGNAVVGAWLKTYKKKDIIVAFPTTGTTAQRNKPIKKEWWDKAPKHLKFKLNDALQRKDDDIYHFLLPDKNMVPSASIKLLKEEFSDEARRVSSWRSDFCEPINGDEFKRLQKISKAVDVLLEEHYKFQAAINAQTKSQGNFFGAFNAEDQYKLEHKNYDEKEKLAAQRNNTNAPYYKLKLIMDYWCSLWFWDMREAAELPTRQQWYDDLEKIINIDLSLLEEVEVVVEEELKPTPILRQESLFEVAEPEITLKSYRKDKTLTLKKLGEALQANPDSLFKNKRSEIVNKLADQYKFFHNELEFIEVFKERGGFDVIVGNPPWVNITMDEAGILSEKNPEIFIRKLSAPQVKKLASEILVNNRALEKTYKTEFIWAEATKEFLGAIQNYPLLQGQRNNLYKCILTNSFKLLSQNGYSGLLHPEGIYEDPKGQNLRKEVYQRLKFHFQFKNELLLFSDVMNTRMFSVNVYGGERGAIKFDSISNLFSPNTIERCFINNETNIIGLKRYNASKAKWEWEIEGNSSRIITYEASLIKTMGKAFDDVENSIDSILPKIHSNGMKNVVSAFSNLEDKVGKDTKFITDAFNEVNAINDNILSKNAAENYNLNETIIFSSPQIFVNNPYYKNPFNDCKTPKHYECILLEDIHETFLPRTNFSLGTKYAELINSNKKWKVWENDYKLLISKMIDPGTERTIQSAIIPPKVCHTNGCISITFSKSRDLVKYGGFFSSLPYDFYIKSTGKTNLYDNTLRNIPIPKIDDKLLGMIILRVLRLNCLSVFYKNLWENVFQLSFLNDSYSFITENRPVEKEWSLKTPFRSFYERRMCQIEIDILVSISLNLKLEDLVAIYNIQFPTLVKNEFDTWYDKKGNIVFTVNSQGLKGIGVDRTIWDTIKNLKSGQTYEHTIEKSDLYKGKIVTYHAPFDKCDRVEDYKVAWAHFEEVFKED
jgi:hypothetical protein